MNERGSRLRAGAAMAVTLATLVAAPMAHAGGGSRAGGFCDGHVFTQPLAALGDASDYLLATGGDFESGLTGFAVTGGAAIQDENESFNVMGAGDTHSLLLPADSSVTTPPLCVTRDYPTMRLFARSDSGRGKLRVEVVYADALTGTTTVKKVGDVAARDAAQTWVLSDVMRTLAGRRGTAMSVRLTPAGKDAGTWSVDDVLVDPHGRG